MGNIKRYSRQIGLLGAMSFGLVSSFALASERVDFEWLEQLVRKIEPTSVEQVLEKLPPDFRSQFTLVYRSRSTQGASLENPRVILYGPDARLLIAFNGDPLLKGYQSLEMIQYRDAIRGFEFRKIDFPFDASKPIEKNPTECLKCHRADPRPNWNAYNEWPGVYGTYDDTVHSAGSGHIQKDSLLAFIRGYGGNSRYRYLVNVAENYAGAEHDGRTFARPTNTFMTHRVSQLGFQRLSRLLEGTPDFARFKWAALGLLWCGKRSLPKFIPESSTVFLSRAREYQAAEAGKDPPQYRIPYFLALFEARGIRTRDWFMSFDSRDRSFSTPGRPIEEMTAALFGADEELAPYIEKSEYQAPEIAGPASYRVLKDPSTSCDALQKKSRAALADLK